MKAHKPVECEHLAESLEREPEQFQKTELNYYLLDKLAAYTVG